MGRESVNKQVVQKKQFKIIYLSILLFIALFWIAAFIHESGHYLAALLSRISTSDIHLHFFLLLPCAVSIPPNSLTSENLTLFHYAGGLFSGVILLSSSIFLFFKYRKYHLWIYWLCTALAISFSFAEFNAGFREGNNNIQYRDFVFMWDYLIILFTSILLLLLWRFRKNIFQYFKKLREK